MTIEEVERPLVLVIFGITGDLAQRKLLPALYQLAKAGSLPKETRIIGVSRRQVDTVEIFDRLGEFVGPESFDASIKDQLLSQTEMHQMDLEVESDYAALLSKLGDIEAGLGGRADRLYYLSIPAQSFTPTVRLLGKTGHNAPLHPESNIPRLLIEKPFGYDLLSAKVLVDAVQEFFTEDQTYRIDHYLAKETVQNILTFRFQNPLFQTIWDGAHIDQITITAFEQLDIEGRALFYEQTGALRDLIQSHLLQLLAITIMDRPTSLTSSDIHTQKLALLTAIEPADPAKAVRAQYEGYRDEVQSTDTITETFARLQLRVTGETWQKTSIVLQTGKALSQKLTEVVITFAQPGSDAHNKLIFRIQPAEGISIQLQAKRPGIDNATQEVDMDFEYVESFTERQPEAYERVIVDAIRGDQTLFASAAEVLAAWKIVEPVLGAWKQDGASLGVYAKGSAGPVEL